MAVTSIGLPVYLQTHAIPELERPGGIVETERGRPGWHRRWMGDDRMQVSGRGEKYSALFPAQFHYPPEFFVGLFNTTARVAKPSLKSLPDFADILFTERIT